MIAFLEIEYWRLSEESYVRHIPVMHILLGFAISMRLVFRTNTTGDETHRSFFRKMIPAYAASLHQHLRNLPLAAEAAKESRTRRSLIPIVCSSKNSYSSTL